MNIGKLLLDLHQCLCEKIEERVASDEGYSDVCSCTVMWSDVITLDHCGLEVDCGAAGCGQAWVRFVGVEPDPSIDPVALRCVAAFTASFEVGIGRCTATEPSGPDQLPSADDFLADVVVGSQDMDVLTQAVLCCSGKHKMERIAITSLGPFGPEGGCFGTIANVTATLLI